jgi:DNA-binding transcriptional LysR family regulator
VEGSCDLLIAYHHPSQPYQLGADRYEMVSLGEEVVAPYSKPDEHGNPMFELPGKPGRPKPYLAYAQGAYLGQMVDLILKRSPAPIHLERVYETDMAEGLKAMALEGHGVAFLPMSAVRKELRNHKLVSAAPPELKDLSITMEVRVYRERPSHPLKSHTRGGHGGHKPVKHDVQALWDYLSTHGGEF